MEETTEEGEANRKRNQIRFVAEILGLLGAFTLFFTWVWNDSVASAADEALARLRTSEAATYKNAETRDIQLSISSANAHTISILRDLLELKTLLLAQVERQTSEPSDESRALSEAIRLDDERRNLEVASARINSEQIDLGLSHCLDALGYSQSDALGSDTATQLQTVCNALSELRSEKDQLLHADANLIVDADSDGIVDRIETADENLAREEAHDLLLRQYSDGILPKFAPLLEEFVELTTLRTRELAERAASADQYHQFAKTVGFWLYVLGSLLVICRTILKEIIAP